MAVKERGTYIVLVIIALFLVIGCAEQIEKPEAEYSYEDYNELENKGDVCPEGMHEYGFEEGVGCVECFEREHCEKEYGPDSYCGDEFTCYSAQNVEETKEDDTWEEEKDPSITGTGSCTEREDCVKLLGSGAFCSKGRCYPPRMIM